MEPQIKWFQEKHMNLHCYKKFFEKLSPETSVSYSRKHSIFITERCFLYLPDKIQSETLLYASCAVNALIYLEPRILNRISNNDILQSQKDTEGKIGDVLYIIICCLQKWEIGISAKANNDAIKCSPLSDVLGFGKKWFNLKNEGGFYVV